MSWFTKRPQRPAPTRRTRLTLESLDGRFVPSSPGDLDFGTLPPGQTVPPIAVPPVINGFGGEEVEHGFYLFSGSVAAASPGGLTVTIVTPFGTTETCVTDADGNFTCLVRVKTNGDDDGAVSAQTVDANGQASQIVYFHISPTP